jgi:nicotinic acid mononucleotide adenylyltransferase
MDEVVFVLPEAFPHKDFSGVGFAARLELLLGVVRHDRWSVASTQGGLFIDMARELQPHYDGAKLHFLCGRDAAERIVGWDYGSPRALKNMFEEFTLLVAARRGHYEPPPEYAEAIARLDLDRDYSEVSATEVRRMLLSGGDWRSLVPPEIQVDVLRLYRT